MSTFTVILMEQIRSFTMLEIPTPASFWTSSLRSNVFYARQVH